MIMKLFDSYTIIARIFPSTVSALPIIIIFFFLQEYPELKELGDFLSGIKLFGTISIFVIILYVLAQIIRSTSKRLEIEYFHDKEGFPTTYLMTYRNNNYSVDYKTEYRELVKKHFNLNLLDENEESGDFIEACKRLNEATKLVITKAGDIRLVKLHNIWYGFFRNLIGGTLYACLFCILGILLGIFLLRNDLLIVICSVLFFVYLLIWLFRKSFIIKNAEAYADKLISEFMSLG